MRVGAIPVVLIPLALATLAGCGRPPEHADASPAVVHGRLLRAERVQQPELVELQGTVEALRQAALSARVMAVVREVRAAAGDRVAAGQPLLLLDPHVAQGQLGQASGALAQAEAARALAQKNLARYEALTKSDAASPLELDLARTQLAEAEAAVEQARGAVEASRGIAEDARVVAPFAGRVVRRLVEVGDLAAPGRPLLILESEGSSRLRLAIPETLMRQSSVSVGSALAVAIDAEAEAPRLMGRVVELSPGADPASHAFQALVELPRAVPSGAAGRAWLPTGTRSAVVVPVDAVLRQGGLELVIVVANGRTGTRAVSTGEPLGDGKIEILSGLDGGEVVLGGLQALPPAGSPVAEGVP